jgi:hypothetical protein
VFKRLRLAVPGLYGPAAGARRWETLAAGWPGVTRASASATTGNLLLEYEPPLLTAEQLLAKVQAVLAPTALSTSPAADGRLERRRPRSEHPEM